MPFLHPSLSVEAVGFELYQDLDRHQEANRSGERVALGVLITPWFMNLIRLPLEQRNITDQNYTGQVRLHQLNLRPMEFISVVEPEFGFFEMCSLFSPMFEFADQAAARETAIEILRQLRLKPSAEVKKILVEERKLASSEIVAPVAAPSNGRRAFLFGRARVESSAIKQ